MMLLVLLALLGCGPSSDHGGGDSQDCEPLDLWADHDGDGFGSDVEVQACGPGDGASTNSDDCDDTDPMVHPGATELCNGTDDDCDGHDRASQPWYQDLDGDGFGDPDVSEVSCDAPDGYVDDDTDCDDADPAVNPKAVERCDNDIDDDCDTVIGKGDDADGDGFIAGSCVDGTDCDDTNPSIHPDATEICDDGIDEDCQGGDPSCGFIGDFELSKADALTCSLSSYDAGRLVEAGDVTGDGLDDVFIATLGGDAGYGGGYVVPGPVTGDIELDDIAAAFRVSSSDTTWGAGRSIGLGDANADGIEDVAFGAPYSSQPGQYVVLGPITGDVDLATDSDFALTGLQGAFVGHGSDLGDIDGDGYADAIVGAQAEDGEAPGSGVVFVQYGPLSGDVDLEADGDLKIEGTVANADIARMIRAGADVDGDGIGDFAVNAIYDSTTAPQAGGLYVLDGPVSITSFADADGWLAGPAAGAYAGTAFTLGDYDGDGRADVAAYAMHPDDGGVYIALGPATGTIDLAAADIIIAATVADQGLGAGLGSGDVDGDGIDELVIGAPWDNAGGHLSGVAFLVSTPPLGTSSITDVAQASFWGASNDQAGQGLAIGDLDGDGAGELLIGGPGISAGGGVYVEHADP